MKKSFFCSLVLIAANLSAQWNPNVTVNTSVAIAAKSQSNVHMVTDTKGGAILSWDDNRNSTLASTDIYAQRMSKGGVEKWTANGLAVCTSTANQRSAAIIDAGNGSVIIAWEDSRAGNYDIYAQKLDSSGNVLWTSNGIAVCTGTTNQKNPKLVSDNDGGAIIVWEDSLNFYWDVTAQRINSVGVIAWAGSGVTICNAPNSQINPKLDVDGSGGAIITWQDKRNNANYDVYAQRVDASGTVQWAANGVVVSDALNSQINPRVEPDGSGGAYIAWGDKRNGVDYDVYVARIDASGNKPWTANGVAVCTAGGNQSAIDMKFIGAAGVLISWKDARLGNESIYAQLVASSGSVVLPANGTNLSNALKSLNPNITRDAAGGAIVAWQDSTSFGWNITAQRMNSAGAILWASGGVAVSNANLDQTDVVQVPDGDGGAIFGWQDYRSASNWDVYAQHLNSDGSSAIGLDENEAANQAYVICYPNPVTANSVIQLINDFGNDEWKVVVYDAMGREMDSKELPTDEVYEINTTFSEGLYFYSAGFKNGKSASQGKFIVTH